MDNDLTIPEQQLLRRLEAEAFPKLDQVKREWFLAKAEMQAADHD